MSADEVSPDVCYRHPNRESWVLCSRCGRTICPECQILTPAGVRCPDCVRETGGSVSWSAAGEARRPAATKATRARRQRAASGTPGWLSGIAEMFNPAGEAPVLSRAAVTIVGILWIAGFFTGNLPFVYGAVIPDVAIQVWRFLTSAFVYPSLLDFRVIVGVLLNAVFFLLIAPAVERSLGRRRFAWTFFAAVGLSGAAMLLSGGIEYGLPLFAMFGAYLVLSWSYPAARTRILILLGVNLLFVIGFSPAALPSVIAGLIVGAGTTYLFQRYDDRPAAQARMPYLISGGVVLGFIALALLRTYVF